MPIDYDRLLDGLSATTEMVNDGRAGLAAIDSLVATAREASGAAGATFTEYGGEGGRVVVASGDHGVGPRPAHRGRVHRPGPGRPALGEPGRPAPASVAEPLLARGVVAIAGHPVRSSRRLFGSIHVYFAERDLRRWPSWKR